MWKRRCTLHLKEMETHLNDVVDFSHLRNKTGCLQSFELTIYRSYSCFWPAHVPSVGIMAKITFR